MTVEACGLCGSDVHAWRQDRGYEWVRTPVVLGHEVVGVVREVGAGVDPGLVGRRAVPISIDGCGTCSVCARGACHLCPARSVVGLSRDGGAAEQLVVPAGRLVVVPDDLPTELAVLLEPTSVATRAVSQLGGLRGGTRAVVSGPGPIGLLSAWLLRRRGVEVVVTGAGRDEAVRLPLARRLGLTAVTAGAGRLPFVPEVWVEASGSAAALQQAIEEVALRGTVMVVALFAEPPRFDASLLVRREVRVVGSYASLRADYEDAVRDLTDATDLRALVTTYPLADAVTALEATADGAVGKAVLIPNTATVGT
ncbi:MAG: alcohol dehydrogenase catalytic domain-containing protein [Streptosporangiales bacterium]|nr:alcohol dehydrogenase catalytic domain-containing protein [Streptosporangiales bacterium]